MLIVHAGKLHGLETMRQQWNWVGDVIKRGVIQIGDDIVGRGVSTLT